MIRLLDNDEHFRRYFQRISILHDILHNKGKDRQNEESGITALTDSELMKAMGQVRGEEGVLFLLSRIKQEGREKDGFQGGISRYRTELAKRREGRTELQSKVGHPLIWSIAQPMVKYINEFILKAHTGEPGERVSAGRFLVCFKGSEELVAYITAYTIITECIREGKNNPVKTSFLIHRIADLLEAELALSSVLKRSNKLKGAELETKLRAAKKALNKLPSGKERKSKQKQIKRLEKKIGIVPGFDNTENEPLPYSPYDKITGAEKLILWFRACSRNGFHYTVMYEGDRKVSLLFASPAIWTWLEQAHELREGTRPIQRPMVIPPRSWVLQPPRGKRGKRETLDDTEYLKGFEGGGYRFELRGSNNLIRSTTTRGLRVFDKHGDKRKLYNALDVLQWTPYRINQNIAAQMLIFDSIHLWKEARLPIGPEKRPKKEADKAEKGKYWHIERPRYTAFKNMLTEALNSFNEPAIYFPYSFDYRGRVYPHGEYLTPQGNDLAKALLEFAEGRHMGDDAKAGGWLAVHGANCWGHGLDKKGFEERTQWVIEHTKEILACAEQPDNDNAREYAENNPGKVWWTAAKKPWSFLAFCHEWAGFQREGDKWVTHLPVFVDGACNGSQHMAALLRCEETGKLVGLTDADQPGDLYAAVAIKAMEHVEADGVKGKKEARRLINIINHPTSGGFAINRDLAKGPVMTYGYGITAHGMRDALVKKIFDLSSDGEMSLDQWKLLCGGDMLTGEVEEADSEGKKISPFWEIVIYLEKTFTKAIEAVAIATGIIMKWLKEVAKCACITPEKKGIPVCWKTPEGFPVYFAKYLENEKKLKSEIFPNGRGPGKSRLSLATTVTIPTLDFDIRGMQQGLAPHIIHSLDAAHLTRTIRYCRDRGILSFAAVHDSYGTHAPNMPILANELRRAFVEIHKETSPTEILNSLIDGSQIIKQMTSNPDFETISREDLPNPPKTGTLDIEEVMKSKYFFA